MNPAYIKNPRERNMHNAAVRPKKKGKKSVKKEEPVEEEFEDDDDFEDLDEE